MSIRNFIDRKPFTAYLLSLPVAWSIIAGAAHLKDVNLAEEAQKKTCSPVGKKQQMPKIVDQQTLAQAELAFDSLYNEGRKCFAEYEKNSDLVYAKRSAEYFSGAVDYGKFAAIGGKMRKEVCPASFYVFDLGRKLADVSLMNKGRMNLERTAQILEPECDALVGMMNSSKK